MFYTKTITFHWDEMLKQMISASLDRQHHAYDKPYGLEYGLVGISMGRASGATEAVIELAKKKDYHVIVGSRQIADGIVHRLDASKVRLLSIADLLDHNAGRLTGIREAVNGIIVLNDGLNSYNKVQVYQAVQRVKEFQGQHPYIVPMVMVG